MGYFNPNETYISAIRKGETGVLKALLVGIISGDPTFATNEFLEASKYIETESERLNGCKLSLFEQYSKQEDEYNQEKKEWNENYFQMQLVWLRDNFSQERIQKIKEIGQEVYKNKNTLGKMKKHNLEKKDNVVIAAGNDQRNKRLFHSQVTSLSNNWWILLLLIIVICFIVFVII